MLKSTLRCAILIIKKAARMRQGGFMTEETFAEDVREEIINTAEEMLTEHIEAFLELAK